MGDGRLVVADSDVPVDTGLAAQTFALAGPGGPYTSPAVGAWGSPGPVRGPFLAHLADGSTVTYFWYRFVDQPSFQQYSWSAEKKATLQAFVERIHAAWSNDRDYMAPLRQGTLVAMDPAYTNKSIKAVANACDSGGLAVLDCATAILAGQAHVALAIGLEKMHPLEGKLDSKKVGLALGMAAHQGDLFPPFTFPHAFAVIMDHYLKTYGHSEEDIAVIPPIFYENACHNPLAHMHKTKEPGSAKAGPASRRYRRG